MSEQQNLKKAFALQYFHTKYSALNRSLLQDRAATIKRFVVDTKNLSDGRLIFDRAIPFGASNLDPLAIAQVALYEHSSPLADAVPSSDTKHHAPVHVITGHIQGAVHHAGDAFVASWIGRPTSIVHYADITDNERETLLMLCRSFAAHGSSVYAVATSNHATVPKTYGENRSNIAGLLIFHPVLFPGTEQAVGSIHALGKDVLYVSQDNEHVVQTFGAASLIAPEGIAPFVYRPGRIVPEFTPLYASLDTQQYNRILKGFNDPSTLVVDEPLPTFWRTFSTFL